MGLFQSIAMKKEINKMKKKTQEKKVEMEEKKDFELAKAESMNPSTLTKASQNYATTKTPNNPYF